MAWGNSSKMLLERALCLPTKLQNQGLTDHPDFWTAPQTGRDPESTVSLDTQARFRTVLALSKQTGLRP